MDDGRLQDHAIAKVLVLAGELHRNLGAHRVADQNGGFDSHPGQDATDRLREVRDAHGPLRPRQVTEARHVDHQDPSVGT
ncbi:hypothetical protein GCM10027030_20930 [Luteococcus sediminum]